MKLTFWNIPHLNDSSAYDIRTETKKEAIKLYNQSKLDSWSKHDFDINDLEKVVIEYRNGFDLLDGCLGEGGFICMQIN